MKIVRAIQLSLCAAALCATCALAAKADTWDKKTVVNFSDSVQIPGQVLPAGTYVFELADLQTDRNLVQIWNADQTELLATIRTIPAERLNPPDRSVFTFDERPGDLPPALHFWFYPGDTLGQEFVHPVYQPQSLE
jgi:hypothetical protein